MSDINIIVIGAGVIGLTTAFVLKQKGYKHVKIVAKNSPGDINIQYTSPYAGAHWRTMAPVDNKMLQEFDATSYKKFLEIVNASGTSDTGIMIIPSYDYFQEIGSHYTDPWYKHVVKDFRLLDEKDILPEGAKVGHFYTTVVINPLVYLKWLERQFIKLGGIIEQQTIRDINVFAAQNTDTDVLINCTGLGAKYLGGVHDEAVYPTRGQTLVVKAPHVKRTLTFINDSNIVYVIPRSDGTVILGGTANKNSYDPFSDERTTAFILKRTKKLCPELTQHGEPEIVSLNVGLRPSRTGGPRFENEMIRTENGRKVLLTHSYGHGGFGYQSSWGSANHTIGLMENGLAAKSRSKL